MSDLPINQPQYVVWLLGKTRHGIYMIKENNGDWYIGTQVTKHAFLPRPSRLKRTYRYSWLPEEQKEDPS